MGKTCFRTQGMLGLLLLVGLACSSDETLTPSASTSSAPGSPSALQIINGSAERMIALDTASFQLVHEDEGSTVLFPGVVMRTVNGLVDMPDRYGIHLEGEVAFGPSAASFIELDLVAVDDQAFITDIINPEKWLQTEVSALPFNFADLGRTLSDIIQEIEGPTFSGTSEVDGEVSIRIVGAVPSIALSVLVPTAAEGFDVGLEVWIGQQSSLLRRVRIVGSLLSTDVADVVRVLTIFDFDGPVKIILPDLVS